LFNFRFWHTLVSRISTQGRDHSKLRGFLMNARLKNSLASGAIAAAALLGAVSPAQAIVYVGNWDPAFGSIFTNLGWRGTTEVVLPDACNGLTGSFANASSNPCGSYGFSTRNAKVEFYSLADPSKVTVETLNFGTVGFVSSVSLNTPGVGAPTALTGLTTSYSSRLAATSETARDPLNPGSSFYFYLKFDGGVASMAYSNTNLPNIDCTANFSASCGVSDPVNRPVIRFSQVGAIPEPETYALMLAGLAAMGFAARRRQKA
jgi:hypothetical protein